MDASCHPDSAAKGSAIGSGCHWPWCVVCHLTSRPFRPHHVVSITVFISTSMVDRQLSLASSYLLRSFALSTLWNSCMSLVPHTFHHSDIYQCRWLGEGDTQERKLDMCIICMQVQLASVKDSGIKMYTTFSTVSQTIYTLCCKTRNLCTQPLLQLVLKQSTMHITSRQSMYVT